MIYGTAWKKERTEACVEAALQAGFRAIDTANQLKHYDELRVGRALAAQKHIRRTSLFLQSKFTSIDGQDARLPYDPNAPIRVQVRQSLLSSLEHLGTDYLDSYLLHGPYNHPKLGDEDFQVWAEMEALHQEGLVRQIGISNVNAVQVRMLVAQASTKPAVIQNRCYAQLGWDFNVRSLCREHEIQYQGFSLLTANPHVLHHSQTQAIAKRLNATVEQVVFRFAMAIGIEPLTGTTNPAHMELDLAAPRLELSPDEIAWLESAG